MEFEVRAINGIENCYASLPLQLIQTLQSSRLPQSLVLELRSIHNQNDLWFVAWSGSASASAAIELAQQFADCIGLPRHTRVQVRLASNLPRATLVSIEPLTEDDWEVLELNSEHAETAFLSQVRVVQDGMRFPLWLHGRTFITFHVVSTFPKGAAVYLAAGTEVTVAPKRRKKNVEALNIPDKSYPIQRALLRLQDPDKKMVHKSKVEGIDVGVVLTTVAIINPETAKSHSLDALQLVSLEPRFMLQEGRKRRVNDMKSNPALEDADNGLPTAKRKPHHVMVRILMSESVAKGHIMIAQSLRLYLGARRRSWIYLKSSNFNLKKDTPSFLLSPYKFNMLVKENSGNKNILEAFKSHSDPMTQSMPSSISSDMVEHSARQLIASFRDGFRVEQNVKDSLHSARYDGLRSLLKVWINAQLEAISLNAKVDVTSLILSKETLVHFEVRDRHSPTLEQVQSLPNGSSTENIRVEVPSVDILFMLSLEGVASDGSFNGFEIYGNNMNVRKDIDDLDSLFLNLSLGAPVIIDAAEERTSQKTSCLTPSSLNWVASASTNVINRLAILLSPISVTWSSIHNLPLPGHILVYGPPGSGKTLLTRAVAKSVEDDESLLTHIVFVDCSELALEKASNIRQSVSRHISEALDHAPSLVIFDDLDRIVSSSSDLDGSQSSISTATCTEFLTDIVDEYEETRKKACGVGLVAFFATVQSLESIPLPLRCSGRFDFQIQLPALATSHREAILKHEIQKRSLHCSDDILTDVASKCDAFDAYDLEILVDRAVHAAIGRYVLLPSPRQVLSKPTLLEKDFSLAMHEFLPVGMRDIAKPTLDDGHSGWDDVGGLTDIQRAIKEMIEFPSKFPQVFSKTPLRLRSNVLLYGPPGCGKTHIVGAAAAACSIRFISVKGPELLNKYIGASEQAVRDIFSKAASAAPCLLFFDEFDSIAPKRGHDNTGVTDRVVNQFLTELDGVEVLNGVFVFAATSRPDLLDAALLRPGRLDRLLFCDFPSKSERLEILRVLSKKLPLAKEVDLEAIASMTDGFSGADLQALLSDAQLAAVHELLESTDINKPDKKPVITDILLKSVGSVAKPSVSDSEKQRLYGIYNHFLDSKRSVAAKSRDFKGKRATLA
uniref:Peroxisomal ATPase PEX1 n=1 Tax=Kalanchoe fedtschenkoi TaxID=63787 RepID=A0A7N0UHM7_KALFE